MPLSTSLVLSRRRLLAAGAALGLAGPRLAAAQATPAADATGMLVDVPWLAARLDDPALLTIGLVSGEEFSQGFIPQAVGIDWPDLEVTDTTGASLATWQGEVEHKLTNLGLTREHTAVVWDGGSLFAARLWWVLHYLDHPTLHMLNGGLPAWEAAGHEVEVDAPEPPEPTAVPYRGTPNPDVLARIDQVEAALGDPGVAFVDARTPDEYAQGHIPGAININYPLNAASEPPRLWKPADELRELYAAAGVHPDAMVIPYCTTGVRSAVTWFSLRLLGYPKVALFTGSWAEWSADPDRPVVVGTAP